MTYLHERDDVGGLLQHLMVIGWHSRCLPPEIWIAEEKSRSLVNCAEGTQRYCLENNLRIVKVSNIYLTSVLASTVGGLIGLLLTVDSADSDPSSQIDSSRTANQKRRKVVAGVGGSSEMAQPIDRAKGMRTWQNYLNDPNNETLRTINIWGPPPIIDFFKLAFRLQIAQLRRTQIYVYEIVFPSPFILKSNDGLARLQLENNKTLPHESPKRKRQPPSTLNNQIEVMVVPLCDVHSKSLSMDFSSSNTVNDNKLRRGNGIQPTSLSSIDQTANPTVVRSDTGLTPLKGQTNPDRMYPLVMYLFKVPRQNGKFDAAKATQLGVPFGPLCGHLKSGKAIKLQDGTQIFPEQVCEPQLPCQHFLVIDVPNADFINDSLMNNIKVFVSLIKEMSTSRSRFPEIAANKDRLKDQLWDFFDHLFNTQEQLNSDNCRYALDYIFHLSNYDVFQNNDYKSIVQHFSEVTKHQIKCDRSEDCPFDSFPFKASALHQSYLRSKEPFIFPELRMHPIRDTDRTSVSNIWKEVLNHLDVYPSDTRYVFLPYAKKGIQLAARGEETEIQARNVGTSMNEVSESLVSNNNKVYEGIKLTNAKLTSSNPFSVRFLGTGSMMPSKYRNVSCISIEICDSSVLLDCGESSLPQLFVTQGSLEEYLQTLKHIRCIFISHHHADHILGSMSVISQNTILTRKNLHNNNEPILLIAPRRLLPWFQFWDKMVEPLCYQFLACEDLLVHRCVLGDRGRVAVEPAGNAETIIKNRMERSNVAFSISVCEVDHIGGNNHAIESFGIRINVPARSAQSKNSYHAMCLSENVDSVDSNLSVDSEVDGQTMSEENEISVTYSGDTRPCMKLVEFGKKSTVLIHEATYDDDLEMEALKRRHSTTGEALMVAKEMECDFVVLTHFSQRYPKFIRRGLTNRNDPRESVDTEQVPISSCEQISENHFKTPSAMEEGCFDNAADTHKNDVCRECDSTLELHGSSVEKSNYEGCERSKIDDRLSDAGGMFERQKLIIASDFMFLSYNILIDSAIVANLGKLTCETSGGNEHENELSI